MNTYKSKIEIEIEIKAFDENDAQDYINDIFGIDDEIKAVKIINIKKNS